MGTTVPSPAARSALGAAPQQTPRAGMLATSTTRRWGRGGDVDVGADVLGHVHVRLLDGFGVLVNGTPEPTGRWTKRYAAAVVKVLALSPRGRLHRDRIVDAQWPVATLDVALPRLHKGAPYARRDWEPPAMVLRDQVVALFPHARLEVDSITFEVAADVALSTKPLSPPACDDALKPAGELPRRPCRVVVERASRTAATACHAASAGGRPLGRSAPPRRYGVTAQGS